MAAWEAMDEDSRPDLETMLAKYSTAAQKAKAPTKIPEQKAAILRENRAVIMHLEKRGELVKVICWQCKKEFAADYLYVRLCSDDCAAQYLWDQQQIRWDPEKDPDERWGFGIPPAIITPKTWAKMQDWAKRILAVKSLDEFRGLPVENKVPGIEAKQEIETDNTQVPFSDSDSHTQAVVSAAKAGLYDEDLRRLQHEYNRTRTNIQMARQAHSLPPTRKNQFSDLL